MAKLGRNDPCHCGSGRKYKRCCEQKEQGRGPGSHLMLIMVAGAMLAALIIGIVSFSNSDSSAAVRIWSPEHGHYHDASGQQVP